MPMLDCWVWGWGAEVQLIQNLGARKRWVFSTTLRSHYTQGRPGAHRTNAGWAWMVCLDRTKNLAYTGIRFLDRPARNESLFHLC